MTKKKELTIAALLLIVGLVIAAGVWFNMFSTPHEIPPKLEISPMTVEELESSIAFCDTVLAELQQELDSHKLSGDEQHEAILTRANVRNERKLYAERLEQLKQRQKR